MRRHGAGQRVPAHQLPCRQGDAEFGRCAGILDGDVARVRVVPEDGLERRDAVGQGARGEGVQDGSLQLLWRDRAFDEVVSGALLHRFHRKVLRSAAGYHDDGPWYGG